MSMSTHVNGFRPPDAEWEKMLRAWQACEAAGVPVPQELWDFFGGEKPGSKPGATIDIGDAVEELSEDATNIYQVDLTKIPDNLRYIRFTNSW